MLARGLTFAHVGELEVVVRVDQPGRDDRAAEIAHLVASGHVQSGSAASARGGCGRIVTLFLQRTACTGAQFVRMIGAGGGWFFPTQGWGYGRRRGRYGHVRTRPWQARARRWLV